MRGHFLATLLLIVSLASCAPTLAPEQSTHPLADRIWAPDEAAFLSPGQVMDRLGGARFVLLGEIHDNARHHALQAWIVRSLGERNRRLSLVVEMIAADQDPGLALFYEAPRSDAGALPAFLQWEGSGWPPFALYKPVFDAAVLADYPIRSGNLDRGLLPALHDKGLAALPDDRRAALGLTRGVPGELADALKQAIADAHCGLLAATAVQPFAEIQYARDAAMAQAMMTKAGEDGAVLIAGAGHARRDLGVPHHLARFEVGGGVVSVAFVEADPARLDPAAYSLPYDLVWFTGGPDRADPCESLKSPTP